MSKTSAEYQRERRADPVKRQHDRERMREWKKTRPNFLNGGAAGARARKHGAAGTHTVTERRDLVSSYHGLCAYCLAPATTTDHVVPFSAGGSNFIENVVPACYSCNCSKQSVPLLVWLAKKRWAGVSRYRYNKKCKTGRNAYIRALRAKKKALAVGA